MDKKTKAAPKIADIAHTIYGLLEPLDSESRRKIISASLTLLGEAPPGDLPGGGPDDRKPDQKIEGIHPKAAHWMKQNDITQAQLEEVFDIASEDSPVIISEAPGKSSRAQTHNAYVLLGLSRLLSTGDSTFDDKAARKLCEDLGCFNQANHSGYMGGIGSVVTGSKKKGWKLTAPGLRHGAALIKQATAKGA
jgi:hypothetical protein